eukprot:TRINITY_DN925_c0_g1_i7.p1 TRINITY_DN925_c0_g1~~TRINITY_DN925_c0_g1_i7.p1  ORF type:complete len:182 (+),score=36.98 TRINITY_DN925_c0_g1_i7:595-1140(+)
MSLAPQKKRSEDLQVVIATRPCDHNDWDDVRTKKGFKVLRCRVCQVQWKIPNNIERCLPFLHECCDKGNACEMLHVRRKKMGKEEREKLFAAKEVEEEEEESHRPPMPLSSVCASLPIQKSNLANCQGLRASTAPPDTEQYASLMEDVTQLDSMTPELGDISMSDRGFMSDVFDYVKWLRN